ncbi:MAG: hypothetical protein ACI9SC_001600 [Gammaproteobacteria bacterium]|jgi:uncharacterized protein (DUF58 family)
MGNSVVLERLPATAGLVSSATNTLHKRQRVYIFLSRYGMIFCANLFVMLIGAVNYNNSLAYALTFLLGGLFMVGMLHTYSNLRGLIISASHAEPVFAGQQACFPLLFDNRLGANRLAIELQIKSKLKKRLFKKNPNIVITSVNIEAGSLKAIELNLHAPQRGHLVPGRLTITSTWPLGFFRAWSYMQIEQHCVIYPLPQGTLAPPGMEMNDEEELEGKGSGTDDFIGFRHYQSGDSLRTVDWKAYARERGLISKRFSGRGTKKILIDWQQTSHLGDIELRLSQLCLWITEAEKQGAQYALSMPGKLQLQFSMGEKHQHECLEVLAGYGLNDKQA